MVENDSPASISVIIPTRNRAERLMQAIDSVQRQTMPAMEIIVVNDASTDQTRDLLSGLPVAGLKVIHTELCRGAGHARNLGIAAASGGLLAFLDDDDLWLPDKLAVQSQALCGAQERVGLVCSAYHVISDCSGRVFRTWHPPDVTMDVAYFLRTSGFMTSIPLLRRECFEQVGGFDEDLAGGQDLDMWIRIAGQFEIAAVPEILAEHHIHGDQITTNLPAKARASAQVLSKHRELLAERPELLRRHLKRAALLHCAAGQPETGRTYLTEAIATAPDRAELTQHLKRSLQDPARHKEELIQQNFRSIDGITLFY